MKWNVFSLETVKTALEPKFVLEKIRYVTDDEEYGEGKSTRFVFRNVEEMPEIDHIERTISTFIRDTYVHFKDKNIKPMRLWQDNLNESEDHIRYSTNHLVSPPLELIGKTYISDESYTHKWLVTQGGTELLERASVTIDVDVIYAYDNVDKVEESSENGEVHGVLILSIKCFGVMTAFRCSAYARMRTKNCISATAQKCEAKNAGSCIRRRSSKSNKSSAKARPRPKYSGIAV